MQCQAQTVKIAEIQHLEGVEANVLWLSFGSMQGLLCDGKRLLSWKDEDCWAMAGFWSAVCHDRLARQGTHS